MTWFVWLGLDNALSFALDRCGSAISTGIVFGRTVGALPAPAKSPFSEGHRGFLVRVCFEGVIWVAWCEQLPANLIRDLERKVE